jgi:predicted glycosyltransferase
MTRVLFHVQHLLGIGHLRRAATLARTMAAAGLDVLLVSGGAPVELDLGGARLHLLPPLKARDQDLRELARLDGSEPDDAFLDKRRDELLALFAVEAPDVLITEQFPFGRTRLRFELLPLLDAARQRKPRPLIVTSVRDVVRRTARAERVAETVKLFDAFDLALIHADPTLVPFGGSFAAFDAIADRCVYTGYVADDDAPPTSSTTDGAGEVVVSVGGGAVGAPLLQAAIAARPLSKLADRRWRLLVGANLPCSARTALKASDGIVVEPARSDFPALLGRAALSVSQAGYNTVVETLRFADRAVLVPFATERESEQTDRAQALASRGLVSVVLPARLSPATLAEAIDRAWAGPSIRSFARCDVAGAAKTVELLKARCS